MYKLPVFLNIKSCEPHSDPDFCDAIYHSIESASLLTVQASQSAAAHQGLKLNRLKLNGG